VDARDVDDEGDPPVAENGRAGEARQGLMVRFQALDDDLLLADDLVENEPPPCRRSGFDEHDQRLGGV
jgi:hypothetical protein